MNIFVWAETDQLVRDLMTSALQDHSFDFADKKYTDIIPKTFKEADIVFGNVPPIWYEKTRSSRLAWVQLESVGFGNYVDVIDTNKVLLTNLRGFFAEPVAESAIAGILALYRKLDALILAQGVREWQMLAIRPRMRLLHRTKILILGAGSIGLCIKKLLQAFDCDITIFSKSSTQADIYTLKELDAEIPSADIIIACLPHSDETAGMINKDRLQLMQADAIFVNVGRGSVVDEPVLIDLLQDGKMGGAVLDVTYEEPIPTDHPLWQCPNTILTQHTGGGYQDELADKTRLFLRNFERFQRGETLLNIVSFERGY